MTSYGEVKTNSTLVSLFAERFPAGHWSFLGPGSETKWYSTFNERPGGEWDKVAELMMIKFGECGHPVLRATSPLSRGTLESKGGGKLSFHFCADGDTIETDFAQAFLSISSVSTEQLQKCVKSTISAKLAQGDPFFAPADLLIMTPTSSVEIPAQENLLQKYEERVERLPQQDRVIMICTDAGLLKTVEVGQYFMTKNIDELLQYTELVTCREYILPRDD